MQVIGDDYVSDALVLDRKLVIYLSNYFEGYDIDFQIIRSTKVLRDRLISIGYTHKVYNDEITILYSNKEMTALVTSENLLKLKDDNNDLFRGTKFRELNLELIDTSGIKSTKLLFSKLECDKLSIAFDTSECTDMSSMFYDSCIKEIKGLEKLDTHSVLDMKAMFKDSKTHVLRIENFNTERCLNFEEMFMNSLAYYLDVSNFYISDGANTRYMFRGAKGEITPLKNLDEVITIWQ